MIKEKERKEEGKKERKKERNKLPFYDCCEDDLSLGNAAAIADEHDILPNTPISIVLSGASSHTSRN